MSREAPGQSFERLAAGYEEWFQTPFGRFADALEQRFLLRMLKPAPGEVILEAGSGTGHFLRHLASSGARCLGLEPSAAMLAEARSRPEPVVDYVRGRAEALPFQRGIWDAVLFMTALEFVEDVEGALQEAMRVLKPGGRLVLVVLNAAGPWARSRRRQGGLWQEARFFHQRELADLLSPLETLKVDYCLHVPPLLHRAPAALLPLLDGIGQALWRRSGALIGLEVSPPTSGPPA